MATASRKDPDLAPPHDIEAEMCALGAMMLSERAAEEIATRLREDDYYRPAHRDIHNAAVHLIAERKAVDLVTLRNELKARGLLERVGGEDYLIQIAESVPSAANAAHYAQIILENAILRRLQETGAAIVDLVREPSLSPEEKLDRAEQLLFEIGRQRLGRQFESARSLAQSLFEDIGHLFDTGQPKLGIPSGFYDLDKVTGGFFGGHLGIIAARPGMGKTSFVLGIALHAARQKKGAVAIFSLEMSGRELVQRLVSMISGVSTSAMRRPNLSAEEFDKLADGCEELYGLPIYIDDSSVIAPLEMRGKCRRLMQQEGLALVIVDYLQLMRSSRRTENRTQEIAEIARALKALAKELDVPVLALSQLSRKPEDRTDKRPYLSDLRESGSIEAEADIVMFIHREDYYKRGEEELPAAPEDPDAVQEAEIIIAKHRSGPTRTIFLGFRPSCTKFLNLKRD